MAIQPYQRKIGIPDAAGGGMTRIADTRSFDIGPAISSLGDTLMSTFEPILADQAVKRGNEEAGKVMFERTESGQLVLPPPPEDGGLRFKDAFDKIIQARYLNEIGTDFQTTLDQEAADRRTGVKKYDAAEFAASVKAKTEGMLAAIDPRIRPQMEEVLRREGLERTRSFTNEWSGTMRRETLQGYQDLINTHMTKGTDVTLKPEDWEKRKGSIKELVQKMRDLGGVSEGGANALFMQIDNRTDGIMKYAESMEWAPDVLASFKLMPPEDLVLAKEWFSNIRSDGTISGKVFTPLGADEIVTAEGIDKFSRDILGIVPNSVGRPGDHRLSIAARKQGYVSNHDLSGPNKGRALDISSNGKPIEYYTNIFKKAGFEILEAKDEYKNPSVIATDGHFHFAFGNKRKVTAEHTLPTLTELTFEKIQDMDPSVRRSLEGHLNAELQKRDEAERVAAAQAREDARAAQEAANSRAIIDVLEFKEANGLTGGSLTAKEKNVYEQQFASVVDVTKLSDPQQRANAFQFIQQKNYIPESVMNWIDNTVRSPNWTTAAEFYNKLGDASIGPYNARIGDLLLSGLEPKTAALLQKANSLKLAGVSDPAIGAAIESFRSGDAFTPEKAISQFNIGAKKDRGYQTVKRKLLGEVFGVKKGWVIPSRLQEDFDIAYAANLELTSQPEKSMQLAVKQVTGRYAASTFFQGNIGPSILTNSYPQKTLGNFFFSEKDQDGNQLIKRVKGQTHRFGGSDPSVRLKSAGDDTARIGRYIVYVYEPNNTSNVLDVFEVDLGKEMTDHLGRKNDVAQRRSRADLLSEARARRTKQQETNARQNAFIPMMP